MPDVMPTAGTGLLGRYFALPGAERRLALEAWCRLFFSAAALRLTPARAVRSALASSGSPARGDRPAEIADLARAVARAAAHHPLHPTCLPRSLTLRAMLRSRGFSPVLRIGVRRRKGEDAPIEAHAWIEIDGSPVGEPEPVGDRFLPFVPDA